MPKITPPEFVIIGLLLGAMATYYAVKSFDDYMNLVTYQVQQNTMLAIKAQCDAPKPKRMKAKPPIWLGDFEGYHCYKVK